MDAVAAAEKKQKSDLAKAVAAEKVNDVLFFMFWS